MERIVCKFGGSSVASGTQFQKVKEIVNSDSARGVIVVSAPGKRNPKEAKITDLLIGCHDLARQNEDYSALMEKIKERYYAIKAELSLTLDLDTHLAEIQNFLQNKESRDVIESRGEYVCGLLMAEYLGAEFKDPKNFIVFDSVGRIDPISYKKIAESLDDPSKKYVIPGFYGSDHNGEIKTFTRGGSDISGAIVARALNAKVYENWTDVSGLLMADPRIVENPRSMPLLTYREVLELAYMGADVFHDEAITPVREAKIPIRVKNTNRPMDEGTFIVHNAEKSGEVIAGIAGKRNAVIFNIEKSMMNKEKGFGRKVLGIFENHDVSYEHSPTGIDSMGVVVLEENLEDKAGSIVEALEQQLKPDKVIHSSDISLIAIVGEGMIKQVGTAARVFEALRDAKINVRIIDQGASELNIIVGVKRDDYLNAINALYTKFNLLN